MSGEQTERLWQQLACAYADGYGEALLEEMRELEGGGVSYLAPRLERRIRELTGRSRRMRYLRGAAALAACAALALLLPRMLPSSITGREAAPAPSAAMEAPQQKMAEADLGARAAMDEAVPEEEMEDTPAEGDALPEEPGLFSAEINPETAGLGALYLDFTLPDNLSVEGMEQVEDRTVYTLAEAGGDDVVLTLESISDELDRGGYTESEIDGQIVYTALEAGENLLILEKDGIRYTMTCRGAPETLIGLGRAILEG